jgi:hypothetical protein
LFTLSRSVNQQLTACAAGLRSALDAEPIVLPV